MSASPKNSLSLQVLEVLKQAMQPGLTDLQMEFDTPAGVTCLTIPPLIPPIVFAEEKLQIYILIRGQVGLYFLPSCQGLQSFSMH